MLPSVLVANRGEIACRIIRTARRLGMRTVAVYSEADRGALHAELADEAHPIGPAPAAESYLRADRILEAARASGAAAIHPGYGFLSERPDFAQGCEAAGLVFVGPPASAIRAMGLKDAAKALAERAGVPVVPGYHGPKQEPDFLRQKAYEIGYPVLIKAVAGGGGKGMRRVDKAHEFEAALASAQREAQAAFGDPRVLVEKYVLAPRHVEVQVFADSHGNVVHLFERDCSLQRRHQKVIEEAPAPGMTPEVREAMGLAAVEAARAVGYVGAGTVEFIADGRDGLRPDRFFFMEMNTRLQVEHPVTEAIIGLDLVELQFRVASGETLPFRQEDLAVDGHAVEARLYAEDPSNGFLPSTGRLLALRFPEGVRVDAGVREGDAVTPHYDPMIAKLIAHAPTRDAALDALGAALDRTLVAGPRTNLAFLKALTTAAGFRRGAFDTGLIERDLDALTGAGAAPDAEGVAAALLGLVTDEGRGVPAPAWADDPWGARDAFQLAGPRQAGSAITLDDAPAEAVLRWPDGSLEVELPALGYRGRPEIRREDGREMAGAAALVPAGREVLVVARGRQTRVALRDPFAVDLERVGEGGVVKAPMHGRVVAVLVGPGDQVRRGQRLAVVEAMKMEHALLAPADGAVAEVAVAVGAQVAEGARLVTLTLAGEAAQDDPARG